MILAHSQSLPNERYKKKARLFPRQGQLNNLQMTREASKRFFFLSCLSIDNGYEPVRLLSPTSRIAVPDCRGSLAVGGRYELQFPITKETQNQGSYMHDRATILRHYHNQVCNEIRFLEWRNLIASTPLSSTHAARMPVNC